jgi:AraC family transcriptional regulator
VNGIIDLHVSHYAAHGAMAAHAHDEPWFCLVVEGRYEERILGETNAHDPGDLLFCPANAAHAQRFGQEGARKVIFSAGEQTTALLAEHGTRLNGRPLLRRSAALLTLGRSIVAELALDDAFASLSAEALTMEALALTARGLDRRSRQEPAWLRRVREFLQDDPAREVTLDQLAVVAGRHPVHLARTFRTVHECTIGDYVRRLRVDRAATLLRTTRRPLLDIALDCGFAGAAQFSRSFRAVHATTPSAWRVNPGKAGGLRA